MTEGQVKVTLGKNDLASFANLIITKIWIYDNLYVLRARNPFLTLLLSCHVRVISKIQVNFRYRRYSKVLRIVSYRFSKFLHYICFWGQEIHCRHSYWATMFGWPWKSGSTSGTGGTQRYLWFCLIDLGNFFTIYVSEIKESIADIPIELPCFGDLGNPGQLPVQEVLKGTDDCVLWIFTISSVFMFLRSSYSLLPCLDDFEYPGQPSVDELLSMSDLENRQNRKLFWIFEVPQAL